MCTKNIKIAAEIIDIPLTSLVNKCFETGVYPDVLKISKVIPYFKKGDINNPSNYRPIFKIPVFSKILKITLKSRLINFLEFRHILNGKQYGIRSKCSIKDAIAEITNAVISNFEIKVL